MTFVAKKCIEIFSSMTLLEKNHANSKNYCTGSKKCRKILIFCVDVEYGNVCSVKF